MAYCTTVVAVVDTVRRHAEQQQEVPHMVVGLCCSQRPQHVDHKDLTDRTPFGLVDEPACHFALHNLVGIAKMNHNQGNL